MSEDAPISCPVLRAFLMAEGALPPLRYTRTPLRALLRHCRAAGAPLGTLLAIPGIALLSGGLRDVPRNIATLSFDYRRIMGGPIDKGRGGTGALRNPEPGVFDAGRFERAFVGFSRICARADGTTEPGLTRSDMRRLAEANRRDFSGSPRTQIFNIIELTALIDVFGLTDAATGAAYVSVAELRALFEHGRLPRRE